MSKTHFVYRSDTGKRMYTMCGLYRMYRALIETNDIANISCKNCWRVIVAQEKNNSHRLHKNLSELKG